MKIFRLLKMLICKHDFEYIDSPKWYFYKKCKKCGLEKGIGDFKFK